MKVFFEEPRREFSVREAAKLLKIAPATASKELSELQDKGFLKVRDERLAKLYSANLDNENYIDLKKYYNSRKLKDSGFIDSLSKFYSNSLIVLFGSLAKGIDNENSDIDILIISNKNSPFPDVERYEKLLKRKINLVVVEALGDLSNQQVSERILAGNVLYGELNIVLNKEEDSKKR